MPLKDPENLSTDTALTLLTDWCGIFQQMALKHAGTSFGDEYLRQSKRYRLAADHIAKLSGRITLLENALKICSEQFADNAKLLRTDRYAEHYDRLGLATDNEQYVYDITEVLDWKPNEDDMGR
jgi:hypothetical protein